MQRDSSGVTSSALTLPVVSSCDGCGACCLEQGAPPDYVALRLNPEFARDPTFSDDVARLAVLPKEAQQLLDHYLAASAVDERHSRSACVWYDSARRGCRYYDFRPSTCRVFELNGPGCHIYRRRHKIAAAE